MGHMDLDGYSYASGYTDEDNWGYASKNCPLPYRHSKGDYLSQEKQSIWMLWIFAVIFAGVQGGFILLIGDGLMFPQGWIPGVASIGCFSLLGALEGKRITKKFKTRDKTKKIKLSKKKKKRMPRIIKIVFYLLLIRFIWLIPFQEIMNKLVEKI